MKLLLMALMCVAATVSADVWSGNDDWIDDATPGFVRVPRVNYGDGTKKVTFLNVDHIVRLSIKSEGKDADSKATLEIVTTEPKPSDEASQGENVNVTYGIRFGTRQDAEKAARAIMKKKAEAGAGQPASAPESKTEGKESPQPESKPAAR